MLKSFLLVFMTSILTSVSLQASTDYNIAKGLAPVSADQSIKNLQSFTGDFRILGSKIYKHDEQAKFSLLIMP